LSEAFSNVITGAVALNVYGFHSILGAGVTAVIDVVDVLYDKAVTVNFTFPPITSVGAVVIPAISAITAILIVASLATSKFISFTAILFAPVKSSIVASISSLVSAFTNFKFQFNNSCNFSVVAVESGVTVNSNDFTVILSFEALTANLAISCSLLANKDVVTGAAFVAALTEAPAPCNFVTCHILFGVVNVIVELFSVVLAQDKFTDIL
jgi:hypothetical protein